MGIVESLLDGELEEQGNQRPHTSVSSDEMKFEVAGESKDWVVVASKNARDDDDRTLTFDPAQSHGVCAGVGYALNRVLSKSDLGESAENDPKRVYSVLRQLGLPPKHVECLTSKGTKYPPTMSNIYDFLREAAGKVGEDGLLFFSFSGHGRVRDNSDGSKTGILVTADNYGTNSADLLTARHFETCLEHCKAKYIVMFLDCCHAGLLADSLAADSVKAKSEVYVLAACSTSEISLCHPELSSGFFTFFMTEFLRRSATTGSLPIGAALHHGQAVCPAMARLCMPSEREKKEKRPGTRTVMHPLMRVRFPTLQGVVAGAEGGEENYRGDQVDAAIGGPGSPRKRYASNDELSTEFLSRYVGDRGNAIFDVVPDSVPIWLAETAMPSIEVIYRHGYLSPDYEEYRELIRCVLCLMARSAGSIFVDFGDGEVSDPDMFLAFFIFIFHAFNQAVDKARADGDDAVRALGRPKILCHHAVLALHHYVVGVSKAMPGGTTEGLNRLMMLIINMREDLVDDDADPDGGWPAGSKPARTVSQGGGESGEDATVVDGWGYEEYWPRDVPDHPSAVDPLVDARSAIEELMHRQSKDPRIPAATAPTIL